LQVYSPADAAEMTLCMETAYRSNSSVYLRIGKSDLGTAHEQPLSAKPGDLIRVRSGQPGGVAFLATGSMVCSAISIAESVCSEATVWSAPFIKPIDVTQVAAICRESRAVVTLEEHSIYGGLGSLIAEVSSELSPVRILRVGVKDRFSEHCGTYEYLLKEHGIDKQSISDQIAAFLSLQS
jgi:transketolase